MAAAFPSGFNTFVPSFDATGRLVVAFSRNPKDFAVNKYATIVPVKRSIGYFLKLTAQNAARIVSSTVAEAVWDDGQDAPSGEWNDESHAFVIYNTIRYAFAFRLGWKAVQQADWKIVATHAANTAQQAMTGRTLNVVQTLTTTGNWSTNHTFNTGTASPGGAALGSGSASSPVLKKAINGMGRQIMLDTLGVVRPKDLVIVVSPVGADYLARSQEVHTYLQQSPFALAQVRGDAPSQNGLWGLPDALYGVPVVIEDTVRVTSRKSASSLTTQWVWDVNAGGGTKASLVLLARPGQLVSEGSSSFSTVAVFMYEEMTVETRDDPDHRRTQGRVVEDYAVNMTSDITGVYIVDITA
jgi:hypothetical protein